MVKTPKIHIRIAKDEKEMGSGTSDTQDPEKELINPPPIPPILDSPIIRIDEVIVIEKEKEKTPKAKAIEQKTENKPHAQDTGKDKDKDVNNWHQQFRKNLEMVEDEKWKKPIDALKLVVREGQKDQAHHFIQLKKEVQDMVNHSETNLKTDSMQMFKGITATVNTTTESSECKILDRVEKMVDDLEKKVMERVDRMETNLMTKMEAVKENAEDEAKKEHAGFHGYGSTPTNQQNDNPYLVPEQLYGFPKIYNNSVEATRNRYLLATAKMSNEPILGDQAGQDHQASNYHHYMATGRHSPAKRPHPHQASEAQKMDNKRSTFQKRKGAVIRCNYCGSRHPDSQCSVFTSGQERYNILVKKQLCINCSRHSADSPCRWPQAICSCCKKSHQTSLCDRQ